MESWVHVKDWQSKLKKLLKAIYYISKIYLKSSLLIQILLKKQLLN